MRGDDYDEGKRQFLDRIGRYCWSTVFVFRPAIGRFRWNCFVAGYGLTRNHNLYFYLMVIVAIAALYLGMWAGFGYIGYCGLLVLYLILRQHKQLEGAKKPDQSPSETPSLQ